LNGEIAIESFRRTNKTIQLHEKKLQSIKVKLSVAKTESENWHEKINHIRKERLLQIKIRDDSVIN
jgi:hypothetical protein